MVFQYFSIVIAKRNVFGILIPGVTQSDLLVINKTDLAEAVGADLEVMKRDAKKMMARGSVACRHFV